MSPPPTEGDADALADLYADDAMLLPPDHEPIQGREAIGDFWRQGTDEGLEVTTLTVEVEGDLGYLVGRYNLPATDEEPADSGKYVMCLKRQRDGSWKLTADIWNRSGDADEDDDDTSGPLDHLGQPRVGCGERRLDVRHGGPVARLEQQPPAPVVGVDLGGRPAVPEHRSVLVGPLEDAAGEVPHVGVALGQSQ